MGRFGSAFSSVTLSVLVGGFTAPPATGQVSDVWFDEPHDGITWHRGDVIQARIVPVVPISSSGVHPVLQLAIGENTREVEGRLYQNGSRAQFFYPVQSNDAAAIDEVRMVKVSLAGGDVDLSGFTPTTYAVDGSSRGVPPVIWALGLSSFHFVPADGMYRSGDEVYWFARFHKSVMVSGAPVLAQRIGDEMREARYRPDVQVPPGGIIFSYTVQAGDCDMDGVGIPANAISGGFIREADGSRAADTSHPAQDPARDRQADATRQVACAVVPVAPAPWLALLASLLLAAGLHLVRQHPLGLTHCPSDRWRAAAEAPKLAWIIREGWRISHRRGLLDRERGLLGAAPDAAGGWSGPSRRRAVAEAKWREGSAGTGGAAWGRRRAPGPRAGSD